MCKHIKRDRKCSQLNGKMSYWDSSPIAVLRIAEKGRFRWNQYLAYSKANSVFLSP